MDIELSIPEKAYKAYRHKIEQLGEIVLKVNYTDAEVFEQKRIIRLYKFEWLSSLFKDMESWEDFKFKA